MFPSSFFIINDSIGSCEASFHSEAVVHIYAKPIHCNAKIKRCHSRTQVFVNVFNVYFSSFPFRLFACKSTFVSLEAACKTIPEIPDALGGQTSPRREKFIVFSQAYVMYSKIYASMVLARRDSRLSSRDSRFSRRETRCGNLLLSGTVESHQLGQTKIF